MRISDEELARLIEVWRSNGFDLAEDFAPFLDLQDARAAVREILKHHYLSDQGLVVAEVDLDNLRKCVE